MAESHYHNNKENPNDVLFQRNFQDMHVRGEYVPAPAYFFQTQSKRGEYSNETNKQLYNHRQIPQTVQGNSNMQSMDMGQFAESLGAGPSPIFFSGNYEQYMNYTPPIQPPNQVKTNDRSRQSSANQAPETVDPFSYRNPLLNQPETSS